MNAPRWPTFWEWIGIYLRLLFRHAPNRKEAARIAQMSDEKLKSHQEKTKVQFINPLRRFYEMRTMPECLRQFLEAVDKSFPPAPPPPAPPPPPPSPPVQ